MPETQATTPETQQEQERKETTNYKNSLLNILDDRNLSFEDKIKALKKYLKDKLPNLKNPKIYSSLNNGRDLTFVKRVNAYIKLHLNKDDLNDKQKRELIYIASICSCYCDVVAKTIKDLLTIEELLAIKSEDEFKGPYKIGNLYIENFKDLKSKRKYLEDKFKGPYKIGNLKINSLKNLRRFKRKSLEKVLEEYNTIEIERFIDAMRYAYKERFNKGKTKQESDNNQEDDSLIFCDPRGKTNKPQEKN